MNGPLAHRRLLVVDDEEINLVIAERQLAALGAQVLLANGGAQALECLDGTSVDAVLLDLRMPPPDGEATARALRARPDTADVLIVAVSAGADDEDAARARAAGVDAFLGKPMDEAALLGLLGAAETPAMGTPAVLDLEHGLRLVRGDEALHAELLDRFLAELAELETRLGTGAPVGEGEDAASVVLAVHRARGTASLLGAAAVSDAAEALESALRSAAPDGEACSARSALRQATAELRALVDPDS